MLLVGGFARSLQFTAFNTLAYADVPRARLSAATSLYATLQQVSLTLGITAGAAALVLGTFSDPRSVLPLDITARLLARSAPLCGSTELRQVDAAAAVNDVEADDPGCN